MQDDGGDDPEQRDREIGSALEMGGDAAVGREVPLLELAVDLRPQVRRICRLDLNCLFDEGALSIAARTIAEIGTIVIDAQ